MGTVFKDRVAKGLCGYCGKENDNLPLKYCKACAEKRSQQYKERKEYFERHGWCNVCGNPEKTENGKMCYHCWEVAYNARQKRKKPMTDEQRQKAYQRNTEKRRKQLENGLCWYCGKRKVLDGRRECIDCYTKRKRRAVLIYAETKAKNAAIREERLKNHLCTKCGEPAKDGYKVCEQHYQISIKNQKRAKEAVRKMLDKWD